MLLAALHPYLTLGFILVVSGLSAWTGLIGLMAYALVHPPRMTGGKAMYLLGRLTPRDVGLRYENRTFQVLDERSPGRRLTLAAWWMPAEHRSSTTAVIVHGYADAKVGALAWAPLLHEAGCHLLAVDLRGHGESEGSVCTGGCAETLDLLQVVNELRAERPLQCRRLVFFGVSMGSVVAAGVAARLKDPAAASTSAVAESEVSVILESPFADFGSAAAAHFALMGLPPGLTTRLALRWAEHSTGAKFSSLNPIELLVGAGCRVLVLASGEDVYVSPEQADAMRARAGASQPPMQFVEFEGVPHLMAIVDRTAAYQDAVTKFLDETAGSKSDQPA